MSSCVCLCSKKQVVYTYRLLQTHTGHYTIMVNDLTHSLTHSLNATVSLVKTVFYKSGNFIGCVLLMMTQSLDAAAATFSCF